MKRSLARITSGALAALFLTGAIDLATDRGKHGTRSQP